MTAAADLVFVISEFLLRQRSPLNSNVHLVGNAGDIKGFAQARAIREPPAELASLRGPKIGFHGTLSADKIDVPLR